MNGLPYYPRYPRDFIEGTIGLPFEVKAAYGLVLDLIYLQGGKLPDDAAYISGVLGVSKRKWNSLRKALVEADKLQVGNGYLTNYRAIIVLEKSRYFQDKQSQNRRRPNKNKGLASPNNHHTEPDTNKEDKSSLEDADFLRAVGERHAARHAARRMDRNEGQGNVVALPPKLDGTGGGQGRSD
ncbi:MAG: DUF1376 domain-containing protein [Pseudomonadota bacterium]